MREEGGMKHIEEAIKKMEGRHTEHIAVYGVSDMTGLNSFAIIATINNMDVGGK
jgi:hypothetical protein